MQLMALADDHDVTLFDCGVEKLNEFLRHDALSDRDRGLCQTHVAIADDARIVGYVTLTFVQIVGEELPRATVERNRRKRLYPAILLGRLAVDKASQRAGVGAGLMLHAYRCAKDADKIGAVHGMLVDAWEDARDFYLKMGFEDLPGVDWSENRTIKMYIPMKNIRQFVEAAADGSA